MSISQITLSGKLVRPHKSFSNPNFKAKAAHVSDRFQYVEMWLQQSNSAGRSALVYWRQASNFFRANDAVDALAKPLTSYYCILNMTKALLVCKGVDMASVQHGVSGYGIGLKTALTNEMVKFKGAGVLAELSKFYDEAVTGVDECNLDDLLYNLPHIHRAYCITIPTRRSRELFIPLTNCGFFRVDKTREAYFRGNLTENWSVGPTKNKLPAGFEMDPNSDEGGYAVRKKKKFLWQGNSETAKIAKLSPYHEKVRRKLYSIHDAPDFWYLKRDATGAAGTGIIAKNPAVLAFAAMHRLSELSRYDPDKLSRHYNNRYGWLLHEFLARTLEQVLDDFTSEITGREVL